MDREPAPTMAGSQYGIRINWVDEVLNEAFAIFPVETVCTEILRGLSDIGNYWYLDKASVQQEHFASALANRRLETLIAATPRPTRQQSVLVGCPPGERHTFSVLMLCLFLCRRGLKVVYLGADVPIDRLEETSAAIRADLIILGAQQLATAATLQTTALTLQSAGHPHGVRRADLQPGSEVARTYTGILSGRDFGRCIAHDREAGGCSHRLFDQDQPG